LAGKEYFVFDSVFNLQFIEMLAIIAPRDEAALFDNELLQQTGEINLEFLKRYVFAFVIECQ